MSEPTKKQEENEPTLPEGFDKPTGPYAGRSTPSFAEETEDISSVETSEDSPENQASERISALETELASIKDQALRAMAETDNIRKRAEREQTNTRKYAITGFATELLNVADNLRRALDAVPEESKEDNEDLVTLLTGIEATERELLKIFKQRHIQKIEPLEEKFDPNFHEVIFEAPSTDHPAGIIIQVVEAGYLLNDRILRPARVGVSKGAPETPPDSPEDSTDHHIDREV